MITAPDQLKERIPQLFALVRTALVEELNRGHVDDNLPAPARPAPPTRPAPSCNGAGGQRPGADRPATPAPIKALGALSRQEDRDLGALPGERCQVEQAAAPTLRQTSTLLAAFPSSAGQADA